jgi:6-phosphofructokinase
MIHELLFLDICNVEEDLQLLIVLGSRFGYAAVEAILDNKTDIMIGVGNGEVIETHVADTISKTKPLPQHLFHIKDDLIF